MGEVGGKNPVRICPKTPFGILFETTGVSAQSANDIRVDSLNRSIIKDKVSG